MSGCMTAEHAAQDYSYDQTLVRLLQEKVTNQQAEIEQLKKELSMYKRRESMGCGSVGAMTVGSGLSTSIASGDADLEEKYGVKYAIENNINVGSKSLSLKKAPSGPPMTKGANQYTGLLDVSPWPTTDTELRELFDTLDANHNGYLSKKEFIAWYKSFEDYGATVSDTHLRDKFSRYNSLGENKLAYEEFCIVMLQIANR